VKRLAALFLTRQISKHRLLANPLGCKYLLIPVHVVLIPLLLLLAALFAAAEASLFSLTRSQLEGMKESRPNVYRQIRTLIFQPEALLSTLIIGNECLNIMISTFTVTLLETHSSGLDDRVVALISVLVSSVLLLTFSEILPKILAFRMPVPIAAALAYPTSYAHYVLTPVRKVFLYLSRSLLKAFGLSSTPPAAVSEKDFLTLVEVGAESGSLDRDEKEMIFNVFNFSDLAVSAVMTPWPKIFCIAEGTPLPQILNEVRKKMFSRIPIMAKDNRVVGILYTKELLKLLLNPEKAGPDALKGAIFPPYIVSTHKKVAKLFREFKLKKVHMALVVDEYGRHLGVVTLEDVLNSLFQTQKRVEAGAR
jgi:putative hemolysin